MNIFWLFIAQPRIFYFISGRGDAILFYSQRPDGELDVNSLHGACPVLKGELHKIMSCDAFFIIRFALWKGMKWGANLWVWNACRYSQCDKDPLNPAAELPGELKASFAGGI